MSLSAAKKDRSGFVGETTPCCRACVRGRVCLRVSACVCVCECAYARIDQCVAGLLGTATSDETRFGPFSSARVPGPLTRLLASPGSAGPRIIKTLVPLLGVIATGELL